MTAFNYVLQLLGFARVPVLSSPETDSRFFFFRGRRIEPVFFPFLLPPALPHHTTIGLGVAAASKILARIKYHLSVPPARPRHFDGTNTFS